MGCLISTLNKVCFNEQKNEYDMSPIRNLPVIFVNGVPGAGNHTVARTISDITGYSMIRPGDLLRAESEKGTARGRLIADRLKAQDEIPEQVTVDLIKEEMLQHQDCKGFILVGFPKSSRMSNMFSRQVKWPEKIVALEVDNETAATRLQAKLSELGRPESDISTARQIVKTAAHKVKSVHKRLGGHILTMNDNSNPKALASTLEEILSDMLETKEKAKGSQEGQESEGRQEGQESQERQEGQEGQESTESQERQESQESQESPELQVRQEEPRAIEIADG